MRPSLKYFRQFNEENSPIYEDANLLEKHLMDKVGPLLTVPEKSEPKKERGHVRVLVYTSIHLTQNCVRLMLYLIFIYFFSYKPRKILTPLEKSLKHMYEAVKDYKDPKGDRQLCQIFMKLPSRMEYPDYYEVIKHPIDMERISHKMKNNFYESVDDLVC